MDYLLSQPGFFSQLAKRFNEGGPFFMSLILICFISACVFLALGFYNVKRNVNVSVKMARLTSDVSILGLVIGLLGSTIGMIMAFDAIDALGNASQSMIAGGLKVSFLTTVFGSITFILPRIGIVILRLLQKV